jgi:hypothetical protein
MWCHADYNSPITGNPQGAVDAYRIPKNTYYLFRKNWANVPYDNDLPISGTATALKIEADTNKLAADGSDCAFIYVTVRDAAGRCIHTGYGTTSNTTVKFAVTGNATFFGDSSVKVNGGKCALLIRSTTTPGPITITASATGLTGATAAVQSVTDTYDPNDYQFITPVIARSISPVVKSLSFAQRGGMLRIKTPLQKLMEGDISILNIRGQNIVPSITIKNRELLVDTRNLADGPYVLSIKNVTDGKAYLRKFIIAK